MAIAEREDSWLQSISYGAASDRTRFGEGWGVGRTTAQREKSGLIGDTVSRVAGMPWISKTGA